MTTLVGRFKDRTRRRLWAQRLHRSVRDSEQLKLIIGAGRTDFDGWITTEQQLVGLLKPSMWFEFFEADSVHAILAEHVWEHLTPQQGLVAAKTCFQFLKPGVTFALLFLTATTLRQITLSVFALMEAARVLMIIKCFKPTRCSQQYLRRRALTSAWWSTLMKTVSSMLIHGTKQRV